MTAYQADSVFRTYVICRKKLKTTKIRTLNWFARLIAEGKKSHSAGYLRSRRGHSSLSCRERTAFTGMQNWKSWVGKMFGKCLHVLPHIQDAQNCAAFSMPGTQGSLLMRKVQGSDPSAKKKNL